MGWYQSVHANSVALKETRATLVGRKLLHGKLIEVEVCICGILRAYGFNVGEVSLAGSCRVSRS